MQVNISEAKTNLSQLVDRAFHGEKIVISKNNLPLVDLVPHQIESKRKLGVLSGKYSVPDELFQQEDEEIDEMFYGDPE